MELNPNKLLVNARDDIMMYFYSDLTPAKDWPMRAELYVYFTWKTFLHRGKHHIRVKTIQNDTQHLVKDARLYAYSRALRTREKGIRLLLIQDLYSERKLRHYALFHKPCGQRLAKHGLFCG